jgi:hypothetical protein
MFLKTFLSLFERMLGCVLSKMSKFMSDIFTNQIPAMTHILKSFNPNNTSPLDSFDELIKPKFLHKVEFAEGEEKNDGGENYD